MRPLPSRGWFTRVDVLVCALIVSLGAMQFLLIERAPDSLHEDVSYVELAKSLLYNHSYVNNFVTERVQPPGLPIILAGICATLGCAHDTLVRAMPVFLTLGLLASYAVIRRQRGPLVAAASCLLVASSPAVFVFVSSQLWPSYPYFFVSMLVLLVAPSLKGQANWVRGLLAGALLAFLLVAAVMIQSAGIALIGALLGWAVLAFLRDDPMAKSQLRFVIPAIFVALLVQTAWLQQGSDTPDWPLPGYPQSYLAQLAVKNGNQPELGYATPRDVVERVAKNLNEHTRYFVGDVLIERWVSASWASAGMAGCLLLMLVGVGSSLLRNDAQLCAIYFLGYECIYLLWPWSFETPRFVLPVLPLAFLYLVEGGVTLGRWSREYPRRIGAIFLPVFGVLAILAAKEGFTSHAGHGSQDKMSAALWVVCALLCAALMWKKSLSAMELSSWARRLVSGSYETGNVSLSPARLLVLLLLAGLVVRGVAAEIPIGRENVTLGMARLNNNPEIQAARWFEANTSPDTVVASRLTSLLHHYSGRRVIWFPPIADPKMLMDGIRRHHIQYVLVVERGFYYYQPPDPVCFEGLEKAYPQSFRLAEASGQVKIYEVLPDSSGVASNKAN